MRLFRRQPSEDPWVMLPPSKFMPQVLDFLDEGSTGDWEKIQLQEATEEKPPTVPAKDPTYKSKVSIIPVPVPPQSQPQRSISSPEDEAKGWEMLDSQCIFNDHQGQIHDIDDDDSDVYGDALEYSTFPAIRESSTTEPPPAHITDFTSGILAPDPVRTDPWAIFERKKREEEDVSLTSEKERQIKEQKASKRQIERTETAQAVPIPLFQPVPSNDAEQDPEKALFPPPPRPIDPEADAESVVSAASDPLSNEPSHRLDRMLLLRAQMVQMEGHLKGLTSPDSDQEMNQTEKILRKMRRQAERRYTAGTSLAQFMDNFDEDDTVSLDGVHRDLCHQKIEEKLEALLSPHANSLFVKIILTKSTKEAKKQKLIVLMLLQKYNLTKYTSEKTDAKKVLIVDIPEEVFADWLTCIQSIREEESEDIWA